MFAARRWQIDSIIIAAIKGLIQRNLVNQPQRDDKGGGWQWGLLQDNTNTPSKK